MNNLSVVLGKENAIAVFTGEAMDETLIKIEKEVLSFVPDTSTAKGRKEIASLANKVAKSKVALDGAGKTLVSDWKSKAKLVDVSRKTARDFLDNLKAKVRLPLTEWENEEKRKQEEAELKAELDLCHIEALSENSIFDRELAIAEKERIAAEKEAEQLKVKEVARLEAEKLEREKLLKEQAAEQARLKAEQEAQTKIDEAKRLEEESKLREEQAKREKLEAENRAKFEAELAEKNRLQAIEDARLAEEQAVREAQEQAKREAERVEQERIRAEKEAKDKAEKKAANVVHRKRINNEAMKDLINSGFNETDAKKIITLIASNKIKNISMDY